eukprot:194775-Amorphochlora_amoeboformis.AAC.1
MVSSESLLESDRLRDRLGIEGTIHSREGLLGLSCVQGNVPKANGSSDCASASSEPPGLCLRAVVTLICHRVHNFTEPLNHLPTDGFRQVRAPQSEFRPTTTPSRPPWYVSFAVVFALATARGPLRLRSSGAIITRASLPWGRFKLAKRFFALDCAELPMDAALRDGVRRAATMTAPIQSGGM